MGSSGLMGAESLRREGNKRNRLKRGALARAACAALVEPLEARCLLAADVIISEFLADNKAGILDKDKSHCDWIEIYNPGSATNLSGWHLTDDSSDPDKWTFPNTPLGAGSYLVVFASGKDIAIAGQELHTKFKLDMDGDYLALVRPDGTIASQYAPKYPPQATDVSYGLGPATTGGGTIVVTGDDAKVLIPSNGNPGASWTSPSFDDSTWMDAMTGVGFERGGGPLPNEIEPNNSITAANSAVYNFSPYSGEFYHLGIAGETGSSDDWFRIGAMQVGDVITIAGSSAPSARGTASDVHVELWRAGSTAAPVASDDDSGPGVDALIDQYAVTTNDIYYVMIRRQNASVARGTYSLSVSLQNIRMAPVTGGTFAVENESSGNNSMASSNDASTSWRAAQYLSRTAGEISSTTDSDLYQYQLSAGDLLTVNIHSSSTLHAKVSLLDSSGKVVAKEDGTSVTSSPGDSSVYAFVVPTTGTYYVQVQGNGSTTGAYNADLYLSSNAAVPTPSLWGSYSGQITTNIGPQMYGTNASAYVRIPFHIDDPAQFTMLSLSMKYDDGFVAYLNGQLVASRNAPASLTFNSAATGVHQSVGFEDIDLTAFKAALVPGNNVLAIQGLNLAKDDADFLILPELKFTTVIPGGEQYFSSPTPGAANQPGALGIVKDTKFSMDRGLYAAPIDVTITSATAGAQIRYTTDGREPTATTGIVYTGPIHITTTTTLRAAAFKAGYLPSAADTQTYIFLQDVIRQPANPAGFPTQWISTSGAVAPGNPSADYAMDPDIINDPAYASELIDDLRSLPTMSLVMNVDDLFGNGPTGTNGIKGIYSNPESWDPDGATTKQWRRSASLELIYPDGTQGFQISASVQIHGGGSRVPAKTPKHSFTVSFRDSKNGELDFPLFGPDATDQFESIVLSARYNNTWVHMDASQRVRGQYIQDQWNADTQAAMGGLARNANFVHLYINGLYWGIYNPTEIPNADFAETYLGGDNDDYDVVKISDHGGLRATDGDLTAWNTMFSKANAGLASDAAYKDFQKYLDIPSFIDYMIMKFYGADGDWDQHNWAAIRRSRANGVPNDTLGGFQFVNWDNERTLESPTQNVIGAEQTSQGPQHLFNKLIQNAEFRLFWADRVHKHFFNDGALTSAAASARYQAEAAKIEKAIVAESARWGDWRRDALSDSSATLYTRDGAWTTEKNRLLNSYFPVRTANVLQQFRNAGLYPTLDAPELSQHGGTFTTSIQVTITNPSGQGTIYYTIDGSDPRLPGGAISPNALIYTGAVTLARSTRIKARILNGNTWSALDEAPFIIGAAPSLRITELMYHPAAPPDGSPYSADDFEFIELQNTGSTPLDLAGYTFANGIHFTFPDGARIDPAQRLVLVRNRTAFQDRYGTSIPIAGEYLGSLDNAGARITLATNLGQVIEDFNYKDGWYAIADGDGYSLVALDPNAPDAVLSSKDGWRPSNAVNGAPASADPGFAPNTIVINELLSHPSVDVGDWIELYNTSDAPVDLSGWFLSDSNQDLAKYRLPAGSIIQPHGYLVFTQAQHFANLSDPGCLVPFGFQEHTGDQAYLTSSDDQGGLGGYRESVDFVAADRGVSFGRYSKSTGGSDFVSQSTPTPGQANAYPLVGPVVINEIMYNPASGGVEFIELKNITSVNQPLYDPLHPANLWAFTNGIYYTFPVGATIPASGYALMVAMDPQAFRSKYAVPGNVPIFGPFTGLLDNAGETLELAKPGDPEADGYVPIVSVERIKYNNQAPWPAAADGGGASLARIDPNAYGNDVANWTAEVNGGSPGRANSDKISPSVQIVPVAPDPRQTPVDSIALRFSEPITGLNLADLSLTRNGQFLAWPTGISLTSSDGQNWTLRGLSSLTWREGDYALSLKASASGIADLSGNLLAGDASESFALSATSLRGGGGDQFYLRTKASNLEIFKNAQPDSSTPTFTIPLSELSLLDLGGGSYRIASDLSGLRVRVTAIAPDSPTQVILDSSQHFSSLALNGPAQVALSASGQIVLRTGDLSIDAQARLDLNNNLLIVQSSPQDKATDLAQVSAWIKAARGSDGKWLGSGVGSSAANANKQTGLSIMLNDKAGKPILTTFAGQSVNENDILVKYTWNGDVNLDGVVDAADYFLVDSGFITQQGQYRNGDLNLDGTVDAADYFLIDSAFIAQSGILAADDPSSALMDPHASIDEWSSLANRAGPSPARTPSNSPSPNSTLAQLFSTKPLLW